MSRKIDFRLDDVRCFKMDKYKKKYKTGNKEMNNTDFLKRAIDKLLEGEEGAYNDIVICEQKIIKILTGVTKYDFENQEEYLSRLKKSLKNIKDISDNKF